MSNQSGISASAELQEKFKDFLASEDRALILEIDNESCVPGPLVNGSSGVQGLEQVAQHLSEKEPRYVVYRHQESGTNESNSTLLFISYVPDHAPVRNKMLYASSTNTVFKQLGGGQTFDHNIFWTELSEFSADGWQAHLNHIAASAPLTEEEESLQDVAHLEADQVLGSRRNNLHKMHIPSGGSPSTDAHSGSGIAMSLDEEIHQALEALAQAEKGALSMHVDVSNEQVVLGQHSHNTNESSLNEFISDSKPQYTVYKHNDKSVLFIYTCPNGSKVKERMLYASNKVSTVNAVSKKMGGVTKVIEAIDGADVSADQLLDHLEEVSIAPKASSASAKKSFAKPKRPGRS